MTQATEVLLAKLNKNRWFANVGTGDLTKDGVAQVCSWDEAFKAAADENYTENLLEMKNEFTMAVSSISPERFDKINDIWACLKPHLDGLLPSIEKSCPVLPKASKDSIGWHIMHALYETEYADLLRPNVFARHISYYCEGRFPCGWSGVYPEGRLMVF
jgi:hypothetical protein